MQQLSNNYKHPARIHQQFIRNSFENHSKSILKSIQNRRKIDLASRMHFRSGPRRQKGGRTIPATARFGSHFRPEIRKSKLR